MYAFVPFLLDNVDRIIERFVKSVPSCLELVKRDHCDFFLKKLTQSIKLKLDVPINTLRKTVYRFSYVTYSNNKRVTNNIPVMYRKCSS